jgi:hypothetical protein
VITARLLGPGAPLRLVVDDTLFHRSGRRVIGVAWHHDPAAKGGRRIAWGNNWVVLGVLVHLPFLPQRAVCLPVLARLWRPKHPDRTKLLLACALVTLVAEHYPDRSVHLVADHPARPTATTWRWPPPTWTHPAPSWSHVTPPDGASRSASKRPASSPASARPATAAGARSSALSPSGSAA